MKQYPPQGLRPNCLLTRYPICFVHGLKNVFVAYDYWNGIPRYLQEHGYETFEFKGPWRGPRRARLNSFTQQFNNVLQKYDRVHVLAHSLGTLDMVDLIKKESFKGKFASVTFISPPFGGSPFAHLGLPFGKLFSSTNETLTREGALKIIKEAQVPQDILVGSILSRPKDYPISAALRIQHKLLTRYLEKKNEPTENDGLVPLESQRLAEGLGPVFFEFPGDHHQVIGGGPWPKNVKTAHSTFLDHAIFLAEYDFKTAQ